MDVYNEEDVIASTLEHLIGQGVGVILVDNWSTDRTIEIAADIWGTVCGTSVVFPPIALIRATCTLSCASQRCWHTNPIADWLIRVRWERDP